MVPALPIQILSSILALGFLSFIQVKVRPPMLLAERFFPGWGWAEVVVLSLYAGYIAGKIIDPQKSPQWRIRIWTLFSVVFFAQLTLGLAGIEKCLMTGRLHLPIPAMIVSGPLYRGGRFFMPILFVATVLLAGAAWCSHLCYVGAWDALFARKTKKPKSMPRWRQPVRVGILAGVITVSILLRRLGAPSVLATSMGLTFGLVGVGVMVLWSRKKGVMVHCITYCPIGVVANWLGRLSPFRINLADGCTDCHLCRWACRYDALTEKDILKRKSGDSCTLCGDCVQSCPGGWVKYRFLGLSPQRARTVFVLLIVVLHAVFLGVARI